MLTNSCYSVPHHLTRKLSDIHQVEAVRSLILKPQEISTSKNLITGECTQIQQTQKYKMLIFHDSFRRGGKVSRNKLVENFGKVHTVIIINTNGYCVRHCVWCFTSIILINTQGTIHLIFIFSKMRIIREIK